MLPKILRIRRDLVLSPLVVVRGAAIAFVADALVSVGVSFVTQPKRDTELEGLVYGTTVDKGDLADTQGWWRSPIILGAGALALSFALYIPFA